MNDIRQRSHANLRRLGIFEAHVIAWLRHLRAVKKVEGHRTLDTLQAKMRSQSKRLYQVGRVPPFAKL